MIHCCSSLLNSLLLVVNVIAFLSTKSYFRHTNTALSIYFLICFPKVSRKVCMKDLRKSLRKGPFHIVNHGKVDFLLCSRNIVRNGLHCSTCYFVYHRAIIIRDVFCTLRKLPSVVQSEKKVVRPLRSLDRLVLLNTFPDFLFVVLKRITIKCTAENTNRVQNFNF